MNRKITLYLLLVFTCISLQSCLFQEEDYFEDTSANRAAADVKRCSEILKASPNGWLMEYYVGEGYMLGGFTLYCLFDENKVTMASQLYEKGQKAISSLYKVLSEQSTMLTFDTYNPLLHLYAEPNGSMSPDPNGNLGGDYEFIIMEATADRIELKGKKYKNRIIMTPLSENTTWKKHMGTLSEMDKKVYNYAYDLYIDGLYNGTMYRNGYSFDITFYDEIGNTRNRKAPFLLTTEGLRLREPMSIDGVTMQHFKWNDKENALVCTDEGATKAILRGINPNGYTNYEDFIGNYTMEYYTFNAKGDQLIEKTRDVSIIKKVENESYELIGANNDFSIPLNYDLANGALKLDAGALLAEEPGQYLYIAVCDVYSGGLTKNSIFGLRSYMYLGAETLTFALVDNGAWGQANSFLLGIFDSKKSNAKFISYLGEVIAGPIFIKK